MVDSSSFVLSAFPFVTFDYPLVANLRAVIAIPLSDLLLSILQDDWVLTFSPDPSQQTSRGQSARRETNVQQAAAALNRKSMELEQQSPRTYLNYRNVNYQTPNMMPHHTPVVPARRPPPQPARVAAPSPTASTPISIPSRSQSLARPQPAKAEPFYTNTLLIYISHLSSPNMQTYLSTILSRYSIGEASIIATNDEVLKNTRMQLYTAAGQLRQDIVVSTAKIDAPLSSDTLLRATHGLEGKSLSGVLCCQHHTEAPADASAPQRDILDYDEAELEDSWRTNLLTLHTLARVTIPFLRRAPTRPAPFFCLDSSLTLSPLDTATQQALLQQLAASPESQDLTFGLAKDELLPPAPSVHSLALDTSRSNNGSSSTLSGTNGGSSVYQNGSGAGGGSSTDYEYYDDGVVGSLPESPTKLWASWARMNE